MKKHTTAIAALLLLPLSMFANEGVEITGTYQLVIACADTYHEEISFVTVPGKSKFTPVRHALNIPQAIKDQLTLRPGMKIRVVGKKQKAEKKRLTKGQIRKHMDQLFRKGSGIPYHCKDMGPILSKIQVQDGAAKEGDAHNHGELKLKPVDDDDDVVEVSIMEHILVSKIDVVM